jgi:hypothetical protein
VRPHHPSPLGQPNLILIPDYVQAADNALNEAEILNVRLSFLQRDRKVRAIGMQEHAASWKRIKDAASRRDKCIKTYNLAQQAIHDLDNIIVGV